MAATGGEFRRAGRAVGRCDDPIACAVHGDRRHRDDGKRRQPALDVGVLRIAFGQAEAVAIAVDHHVDVVGIVEGHRRSLETDIVERPVRRPLRPQYFGDFAPVGGEPRPAAFELEIILVPQRHLAVGALRRHGFGDVLDQIGIDADKPDASLRPQRRTDTGRAAAPVIAGEHRPLDAERIHQRHHVGADRGLLARPRRRGIAKPSRSVAAQIGNDDAAALRRQLRRDVDIGMNVVGETVHQHHSRPAGGPRLVIGDVEHAGIDMLQRLQPLRRRGTCGGRGGGLFSHGKLPC